MRRDRLIQCLLGLVALTVVAGQGGAAPAIPAGPLTSACPASGPVAVDGRLSEAAWTLAPTGSELTGLGTRAAAPRLTTFRLLYTAEALLVGIECQTVAGGRRVMAKPTVKDHDGPVFADESIELYLQPGGAGPYYHFVANSLGTQYEGQGMTGNWDGAWAARTSESELGWQLEISIPYATLGVAPAQPRDVWRFNVCRNDRTNQRYCTWAEVQGGFHDPAHFAALRFAEAAVGVSPCRLTRQGRDLTVALETRAGASAQPVHGQFMVQTPAGRFDREASASPAAGATADLSVTCPEAWTPSTYVSVRHAVTLNGTPLFRSPLVNLPAEAVRVARPAQASPVEIGNGTVALVFDQNTGNLLRAENGPAGLKVEFGAGGTPLVEMDVVRYLTNPRFFRPEDVQTLVPGEDTLVEVRKEKGAAGETLVIAHRVSPGLRLRLTVAVPKEGTETQWGLGLENELGYEPSKAVVVHRVRYPCFSGVDPAACGADPYVILPVLMGQKFPDPGKTLVGHPPVAYIGAATMGWLDFYGAQGGLYVKVGDLDPLPQTGLVATSDARTGKLTLGLERWALAWPGDKWTPGPAGVAVHGGDWHEAADLYRAWFRKNFKPRAVPQWLQEADGYVMSGGPTYEFADFPRIVANAKALGIDYVQLWSEMTGGDITYHAFFLPNPYMGTEQELAKGIADLHSRGGHIGFYLNFNTGDPLMGTFVRQPGNAQKIPAEIPRPAADYMKDNWVQQSIMSPAGSYSTWNTYVPGYLDGYWNTCPAAKKWTDYYYWWVVEKWAKQYKADVWYLDSCPVSRGAPCFAWDHGHDRPAPEGQSIIDFYKRLSAGAPPGFCLMQEYSSDRLLPYSTHALGLPWHAQFARPEVVRYTLPEYPLFSGLCNGSERVSQLLNNEPVTWRDAMEFVFLIGNRYELGVSNRPPDMIDPWQKKMVDLRRACRPEMNHGDFLDDLGLGKMPEGVYAKLFRRADRARVAVTLLDRRKEPREPFAVTVDLARAGVGAARGAKLVTLAGEQALPTPQQAGRDVTVTVPVFPPRCAALLIETQKPAGVR